MRLDINMWLGKIPDCCVHGTLQSSETFVIRAFFFEKWLPISLYKK